MTRLLLLLLIIAPITLASQTLKVTSLEADKSVSTRIISFKGKTAKELYNASAKYTDTIKVEQKFVIDGKCISWKTNDSDILKYKDLTIFSHNVDITYYTTLSFYDNTIALSITDITIRTTGHLSKLDLELYLNLKISNYVNYIKDKLYER